MEYRNFTSQDFALDEKFQQWVRNPDKEINEFWSDFISKHPEKQEEIAKAIELVYLSGLSGDQEANESFLTIWDSIKANALTSKKKDIKFHKFIPVAAAIAGLLILSVIVYFIQFNSDNQIEYSTSYGEIKEVTLPDGSGVTLNSNSRITYIYNEWNPTKDRTVLLEGEAFFNIVKTDDQKKFIINTPEDVKVQVLGTKFNVNTRREYILIYLQSGKVLVNLKKQEVVLEPGELASYHKNDKEMDVKKSSGEQNLAWKNNLFIFDDTPLSSIVREIEDFFGLKLLISNDSIANLKITAKVPRDHPDIIFNVLSETLQVDISKKGNIILIE